LYVKEILTPPVVAGWDLIPVARSGQQKSIPEICNGDPDRFFGEIRTDRTKATGFSFVYATM
jgi:hypothetical protein